MPKKIKNPKNKDEEMEEYLALKYVGIRNRIKQYGYTDETAKTIAFIKTFVEYQGKNERTDLYAK